MQDSHTALSVDVEEDLLPLSALLHQRGVVHRIFEEGGRQVLRVREEQQLEQVRELYRAWRSGEVRIELTRKKQELAPSKAASIVQLAPVTLALIFLSLCGFLLVYLPTPAGWLAQLTFSPFDITGNQIVFQEGGGQYWRLLTPAFLHFGWLHIVFNSLWMWDLGRRVEQVIGHFNMLMLFLVIAVVANICQFRFGGPGLFGGMSGVVYGLLGFSWVAPLLQPRWVIQPSSTLMLFMVGWLVLCLVGVVEGLGFGAIANAAHLGGLCCGLALGAVFGLLSRFDGDKS